MVHAHGGRPPLSCSRRCSPDRDASYVGALDSPAEIGGTDTPPPPTTRVPPLPFRPAGRARKGSRHARAAAPRGGCRPKIQMRWAWAGAQPPPPPRYTARQPRCGDGNRLESRRKPPKAACWYIRTGTRQGKNTSAALERAGEGGQPRPHVGVSVIRGCDQWTAGDGVAAPLACGGPAHDTPSARGGVTVQRMGSRDSPPPSRLLRGPMRCGRPLRRARADRRRAGCAHRSVALDPPAAFSGLLLIGGTVPVGGAGGARAAS